MAIVCRLITTLIIVLLKFSEAHLHLAKKCGQKTCDQYEYCSDSICTPCLLVCEKSNHNYEEKTCQEECQDYIQDFVHQYVRRSDIQDTITRLYTFVAISLVLSTVVFFFVLGVVLYIWIKHRRQAADENSKLKKKMQSVKAICNNNASPVNNTEGCRRLKLEMPAPNVDMKDCTPPSAVTTMTPLSTRHPAEDATLEYAYDNPALAHSPVLSKDQTTVKTTPTETSF